MQDKYYKVVDLFGSEEVKIINSKRNPKISFTDYEGFVEKFEPKKTTDDCYTPPEVYNAILKYLSEFFDIKPLNIIRPFYPGGDYESIEYSTNDIIIDNPPFSIVSKIAKFYTKRGIKFFIFAPHLTLFSSNIDCTCIVCGASIIYHNGAVVKTSFLSNLFGNIKVLGAPSLYTTLEDINDKNMVKLPKYKYPVNVLTVSMVAQLVERGIAFSVEKNHAKHISQMDSQKSHNKAIFGSGFLLSEKAAAEKAAAEKAAAEKENIIIWKLSEKEQNIINELGQANKHA